jgi:hypothetical protein
VVGVEVEAKTGNVRFDSSDHRLTLRGAGNALPAAQQMRFQIAVDGGVAREVLSSGPTPADAASSGDAGLTGAGETAAADGPMQRALRAAFQSGTPGARVMAGPEAAQMVQGLLSGDRSQRLAAVEALKQLKANRGVAPTGPASQPAPASTVGPSAPATFDPMGPASPGSFNPAHPSTPGTFNP